MSTTTIPVVEVLRERQEVSGKTRILLVDDHDLVRRGLRSLLALEADFEIVGEARNGELALGMISDLAPDLVVLDMRMPVMDGLATLHQLHLRGLKTSVIVLTGSAEKQELVNAMKSTVCCKGVLLKGSADTHLVKVIREVLDGKYCMDPDLTSAIMKQFSAGEDGSSGLHTGQGRERSPLSNREREVVALVAQGYKNKEMAEKMFISEQTVKNHLHNIFDKVGVSDRLELALYAIHKGLHLTS